MSKKRKKHKVKVVDESNTKLFISNYLNSYASGHLTDSELESKILDLIAKFNVTEVIQYLPSKFMPFLTKIAIQEDEEESIFMLSGSFGLEHDCETFITSQQKTLNKAKKKLQDFYQALKKNKKK